MLLLRGVDLVTATALLVGAALAGWLLGPSAEWAVLLAATAVSLVVVVWALWLAPRSSHRLGRAGRRWVLLALVGAVTVGVSETTGWWWPPGAAAAFLFVVLMGAVVDDEPQRPTSVMRTDPVGTVSSDVAQPPESRSHA